MKTKKGFTLIELLAVIVVLAVIVLIAVPIVLNIIENARKGAAIASARSYIKATETYIVSSELNKKDTLLNNNKYNVTSSTTIDGKTYRAINNLVEIKGSIPNGSSDYITLGDSYQVVEAKLSINGYEIKFRNEEVVSIVKGKTIEVESITLDKTNESIEVGKTLQLNATIVPNNADNKDIIWTSSDESIATVDSNGLITGIKLGSVKITATTSNGKTATATVSVINLLSEVASVGDYVAYDAGEWAETVALPTSHGQFGGYTAGQNKANSTGCGGGSTILKGWRVLNINKSSNTVTIIHAAAPECYYHGNANQNESITKLNNRVIDEYLNNDYADSAHNINYNETYNITGSSGASTNSLRKPRVNYWLASTSTLISLWYVCGDGTLCADNNNHSYGVRPIIVLKTSIKTTGKTIDAVGQVAWSLVKP